MKVSEFLTHVDVDDIGKHIPTFTESKQIDTMCATLSEFNSVTKTLQRDNVTLAEARILFDAVIDNYSNTKSKLDSNARIVRYPHFEVAVVKIQEGKSRELILREREAVSCLLKHKNAGVVDDEDDQASLSFAEKALNKRKISHSVDVYLDTRFIMPTTNLVERFFSKAGMAFSKWRKSLAPASLEIQMFLHYNAELWGVEDVHAIMK